MTGRLKFVDADGLSISPDNTLRIPYEYQEPDAYDRSCRATGIGESQLPDMECPSTFVCDAPDAAVEPLVAKFTECVDSMNCAMLKGITTKISSDSPFALFNHQMIPRLQQNVNLCKALDVFLPSTVCDNSYRDRTECVLKVLCQEIINVQNVQIQTMRGVLAQLNYPNTDNCVVDIPVDPQTACEAKSGSTGYSWCVLTQTCVPPRDDACLEAACEENSIVTGKHWCALTRTCFSQGDKSCDKAYCELNSDSTGFAWCELTDTCVAPGDDACLEAECEENSVSTGYHWCALTLTCFPPGDKVCDQAYCDLDSGSTGYEWCYSTRTCEPPGSDVCDIAECNNGSTGYYWCALSGTCNAPADPCPTDSEDCEDDKIIKFLVGENKKKTQCNKIKASQCNTEYETKSGGIKKPKERCPSICNKKCVCAEDPKKEHALKIVKDGTKFKCEEIKKEGLCNAKLKSTGGKTKTVCPVSCKYKDCK